ncbi:MAG TPA: AIR synthase related protein [Chitinophagaceae bacterium]|nr:AIR synthase related protein [Chitinophagaceae bacterium]
MSLYSMRGVSAQKEEVHAAVKNLDQGIFPKAFCKIYPDYLVGDKSFINVMHADGAGTKSILAYLYWKETGDASVWKEIAQDAIVMNLDDLLCVGIYDNIIFNSTIDRNKNLISAEVLEQVIDGTQDFFDLMKTFGINIHYLGGETADVGDVVRTIAVNGTMMARWPKSKIISNEKIKAGNVIVGLASFGKATYEKNYNSGIGSNGLTSARHDLLGKYYAENYKESYDNSLISEVVYIGSNNIADIKDILSPTRTYAPLLKNILENDFDKVYGLIHCSGGGQTKCLKYIPENVRVIKDNLFHPPPIFQEIKKASNADDREMYQVFNMGCRMEIYTDEDYAAKIIEQAALFKIDAQIIGRVEESNKKELVIKTENGELVF